MTATNRLPVGARGQGAGMSRLQHLAMEHGPERAIAAIRQAAALPRDTQLLIDRTVQGVGRARLTIADDVLSEGLTYSLPNWLAVPYLYWEGEDDHGRARRVMNPSSRGERHIGERTPYHLPISCTIDDTSLGIRELLASQRVGTPLDTNFIAAATRNNNEEIEDTLINGWTANVGGFQTYGLLTAPNAGTQAFVSNEAWTASGHSGEDILADVMAMISVMQANRKYGPYNLYIPTAYGRKLVEDYKSATSGTIMERLTSIDLGTRPLRIRVADMLPADTVVLVQMTSDVLQMVVGQEPTPVSWDQDGSGWLTTFAVLSCMVPRIMTNAASQSGIVIGTPAG